jgi:hypothetical protein
MVTAAVCVQVTTLALATSSDVAETLVWAAFDVVAALDSATVSGFVAPLDPPTAKAGS